MRKWLVTRFTKVTWVTRVTLITLTTLAIVVMSFGGIAISFADEFVNIPDPNLRKVLVEDADTSGDGKISMAEARALTYLSFEDKGIKTIAGLEAFVNIKSLYMTDNAITDLGPLKFLVNLKTLYMNNNQVTDLSPLANTTSLESIHFSNNKVKDISPLKNLPVLDFVELNNNGISDLSALDGKDLHDFTSVGNVALMIPGRVNPLVDANTWARADVVLAEYYGLVESDLKGQYTSNITRKDFCRLVINMSEMAMNQKVGINPNITFTDTSADYILKAASWGIATGETATTFNPEGLLTREEMSVIIYRAAKSIEAATGTKIINWTDPKKNNFSDAYALAPWATTQVKTLFANGIINGVGGNKFDPKGLVQKQQAVSVVKRIYENFLTKRLLVPYSYSATAYEDKVIRTRADLVNMIETEMYFNADVASWLPYTSKTFMTREAVFEAERNFVRKTGFPSNQILASFEYESAAESGYGQDRFDYFGGTHLPLYGYGIDVNEGSYIDFGKTIDEHAKIPIIQGTRIKVLAFINAKIKSNMTDQQKVDLIYDFIMEELEIDPKQGFGGADAREYCLFNGTGSNSGYSFLFKYMCSLVNVSCLQVHSAYTLEDLGYMSGMTFFASAYYWNVVHLDGVARYYDLYYNDSADAPAMLIKGLTADQVKANFTDAYHSNWRIEGAVTQ